MSSVRLRHVLISLTFILVALMVTRPQTVDPDMYWHITSGELMLDSGQFIEGDVFSHTLTGVLRPHHEWLSEVLMAVLYRAFGDYGVTFWASSLTLVALFIMYRLMDGALGVRLALLLLAAQATQASAMGRPQIWMLIFSLILVGIVVRRTASLLWIPVIMLVWANLHGGWITGYIILGAAIFSEIVKLIFRRGGDVVWLRQLILASLAGVVALLVNPYGVEQLLVPLDTFTQAARPFISEWLPPQLLAPDRVGFLAMLTLGLITLITQRAHISLLSAILLVGFGAWALMTSRIVVLFMLIAPVILAPYVSILAQRYLPRLYLPSYRLEQPVRWGLPSIIIGCIVVVVVFITGSLPERLIEIQRKNGYPVDAVAYLRTLDPPQRELLNDYTWGGYLIYSLPQYPVFIDGRADLYDDFFFVYQDIMRVNDDWQSQLAAYNVRSILIKPTSRLAIALRSQPDWTMVYEDENAVIFTTQQDE